MLKFLELLKLGWRIDMAIRKTVQYSPFNASLIDIDHFQAIAATQDPNELEYTIQVDMDLDSYSFPVDAELDLEVIAGDNLFTAKLGLVSSYHQPKDKFVFDVKPASIRMRLRVTPNGKTHLIGYTKLRACYEGELTSLMLVSPKPMGQVTWLFECETDDIPKLYLNEDNWKELQQSCVSDVVWQGQILPQCIYAGFLQIANNNFEGTNAEDKGSWQYSWWLKAEELCPQSTGSIKDKSSLEDKKNWAEELSKKFSSSHKYFNKFISQRSGETNS